MTRFEPRPGLDEAVADRIGFRAVLAVSHRLGEHARANAPDAKVWVTARDERVRPSHRDTDGQVAPDNLRYLMPKTTSSGALSVGYDQAREPRDPDLPMHQRIACRCVTVPLPGAIARAVEVGMPVVAGARVEARVQVRFPRVVESEHPSTPDRGGGWLLRAKAQTAAATRARGR